MILKNGCKKATKLLEQLCSEEWVAVVWRQWTLVLRTWRWVEGWSQHYSFLTLAYWSLNQSVRAVLHKTFVPFSSYTRDTAVTMTCVFAWKDTERTVCGFPKAVRYQWLCCEWVCLTTVVHSRRGSQFSVCNCRQDFYHKPARIVSVVINFAKVLEHVKASELVAANPVPRSWTFLYSKISGTWVSINACSHSGQLTAECDCAEHCNALVFCNFNFGVPQDSSHKMYRHSPTSLASTSERMLGRQVH